VAGQIAARNVRRVGDVDKSRPGLFVFNCLVGDDADLATELWEYLSGWYAAETGLDSATLLAPLEGEQSDYVLINHARWDGGLPAFAARQLPKKTFRSYLLANLKANHVAAMPVLYRLALPGHERAEQLLANQRHCPGRRRDEGHGRRGHPAVLAQTLVAKTEKCMERG
jgi:hypothetical protein